VLKVGFNNVRSGFKEISGNNRYCPVQVGKYYFVPDEKIAFQKLWLGCPVICKNVETSYKKENNIQWV
jgi:hypothetical protein